MESELADPLLGQLVAGRYRVVRQLGEGGMGHVYLATHEAIEKQIALKVLKPEYSAKEDIVTRFQQEAISASRIKHPNVLEVFDFGKLENGRAFLAMEFLAGNDLADELQRHGFIHTRRALRIMMQICRALASAHKAHVVHRDMKPDNVFLLRTGDGEEIVKIVDFGIAQLRNPDEEAKSKPTRRRLTKTGMIFGTPEYMAPEQAAGRKADQRVDVYAGGIILFEMLTGAVPFTGDSFMAVLAAHLNDPAPSMLNFRPDLEISQELHQIVDRALAKNPDERYGSMSELSAALLGTPEGQSLQLSGELNTVTLPPPPPTGPGQAHPTRPQGSGRECDPVQSASAYASSRPAPAHGTMVASHAASPAPFVPERPQTLEAAATSDQGRPVNEKKGGAGWVVALSLLGAGATAAGVLLVWPKLQTQQASVEPVPAVAAPPEPAPEPVLARPLVSQGPSVEPAPAIEPETVTITIETTPPGAVVEKDGFQVCDKTPCEVKLPPGDGVQFDAALGGRTGSAKVLPQQDQQVMIELKGPAVRAPARPVRAVPKMCEVNVGGLKILRECPK
jgi:serine/threonine-protein kinase